MTTQERLKQLEEQFIEEQWMGHFVPCERCDETGEDEDRICTDCQGGGRIYVRPYVNFSCPSCKGTKKVNNVRCPVCLEAIKQKWGKKVPIVEKLIDV